MTEFDTVDNLERYSQLKADIIAIKEYIGAQYGKALNPHIDCVLAEMNDLLLGIERGRLCMPDKRLWLACTWSAIDGAYDDDAELVRMIGKIQQDIYALKRHITVLAKHAFFSHRNGRDVNWMFPNLECKTGKIRCIAFRDEDMFAVSFPNGYEIDLDYLESDSVYMITVVKDNDWTNIIEERRIALRSNVEECLQSLIYQYETQCKG